MLFRLAVVPNDQFAEARLGGVQLPLADLRETHALLERRNRLFQFEVAAFQLPNEGLQLGQRFVEGELGVAVSLGCGVVPVT